MIDPADYSREFTDHCAEQIEMSELSPTTGDWCAHCGVGFILPSGLCDHCNANPCAKVLDHKWLDPVSLALAYRAGRPWRATERQVENHGDNAEFLAWRDWCEERRLSRATQQDYFLLCCAVADAICPPPTFRAGVIADWIEERTGYRLDAAECQAMLRPKVKPLVWRHQEQSNHIAEYYEAIAPHHVYIVERAAFSAPGYPWQWALEGDGDSGEFQFATAELARAAAQAHWEKRAEEFYREAFE